MGDGIMALFGAQAWLVVTPDASTQRWPLPVRSTLDDRYPR
jgi:hypothetical protein